jgi:hypothetical protein
MKQYAASPVLNKLIEYRSGYFSQSWVTSFYNIVWNVDTAQGFGLDIWGRIVGVGRELQVPAVVQNFGFNTTPQSYYPFNEGTFYDGPSATQTYRLSDNSYRVLILAKALSNISATDCRSLNRVINNLFPNRGRAYVNDNRDMSIRITFEFFLQPWERAVLTAAGVMPRPAGVALSIAEIPTPNTFGFAEMGSGVAPFDSGTFLADGAVTNAN